MSLVSRDCTSPPRVRVKKPSDWACRWVKSRVRSVCMTFWPILVAIQVCTTPMAAVAAATATSPPASQASSAVFWCGSASSMMARIRKGWARPMTEAAEISSTTTAMVNLCGVKSAAIREGFTGWSLTCLRSAGFRRATGPPRSSAAVRGASPGACGVLGRAARARSGRAGRWVDSNICTTFRGGCGCGIRTTSLVRLPHYVVAGQSPGPA